MDITISRRSLLIRPLGVGLLLSSTICYFLFPSGSFLILAFCISLNGLLIYQNRRSKPLVLFYIFLLSYFWILTNYFWKGREITYYTDFRQPVYYYKGLYLFSVFLGFLSLFNNLDIQKSSIRERLRLKRDPFIFWLNVGVLIVITLYGKTGQNIFQTGGYGNGTVNSSSLNEYYLFFFLITFIFSKGIRLSRQILLTLAFVYCVKNVLFGTRVEDIQLILLIFILMYEEKVSNTFFYSVIIMALVLFTLFTNIRSDPSLILHPNIKQLFLGNGTKAIVATNQGDVFHAAVRMVSMADTGVINVFERIYSFILFLASAVTPYSKLPSLANLASYLSGEYPTGGGGLIFGYFYVWLSYPGIILIAFLLNKIFTAFVRNGKQVLLVYSILVLCTFPRWIAYIPVDLIKLCFIGSVYYFLMNALHNSLYRILKTKANSL